MTAISKEAVELEVQRYWAAICLRSAEDAAKCFSPWAVVFGPAAERAESGQVATLRRAREYMHAEATLAVKLGRIDVQILSDTVAVASYPYSFEARNVAKDFCVSADQRVSHARATQVFQLVDGALKIAHEHLSVRWDCAAAGAHA
jgi:Domain of unknown function (DUF4440)